MVKKRGRKEGRKWVRKKNERKKYKWIKWIGRGKWERERERVRKIRSVGKNWGEKKISWVEKFGIRGKWKKKMDRERKGRGDE